MDVGVGAWRNLENNALSSLYKLFRNRLVVGGGGEDIATEYTQSGNGRVLAYIPSGWKN